MTPLLATIAVLALTPQGSAFPTLPSDAPIGVGATEPCVLPGVSGSARCGVLRVPEDREGGGEDGRTLDIAFVVLEALEPSRRTDDAVMLLPGGPGSALIPTAGINASRLRELRSTRDVVLPDVRGVGRSGSLSCPIAYPGGLVSRMERVFPLDHAIRCRDELSGRARLDRYTTAATVEDLEELRTWLGYPSLNLMGTSYGTRVAQVYMRRHAGSVRTVVLNGVAPVAEPLYVQHAALLEREFDATVKVCRADQSCHSEYPDLEDRLEALVERIAREPIPVRVRGETVPFGSGTLTYAVRGLLYGRAHELPALIHRAAEGDVEPLAEYYLDRTDRFAAPEGNLGYHFSVLCAEDIAPLTDAWVASATAGTLMGDHLIQNYREVCRVWPHATLPDDHWTPITSDIPTLVLSGSRDPVTPPEAGEAVARHLTRSLHIVVPGGGHGVGGPCVQGLIDRLVETGSVRDLDPSCVDPGGPDPLDPLPVDTLRIAAHARFLADDLLEGRGSASRGERVAALYLTTNLYALGIGPLPGSEDHRIPVPLSAVHVDDAEAYIRITGPEGSRTVRPPAFYHPGGSRVAFSDFGGPLLFAGPTASAHAALADLDISGAVVILTPPWSGLLEVQDELVRRGAAGSVALFPDEGMYERLRIVRGPTRYFLPDGVRDPANQGALPTVVGGPEVIAALGLDAPSGLGGPVERATFLDEAIEARLRVRTEERTGFNVAGHLVGSDPALRDEWVVVVAHYDHVGFGEPTAGDSIWNGFVDNAVGTAMVLELARILSRDPPQRSVAFLLVTAEEQGLLGSNWFVHRPPLPLDRIHAVINLDGGAPPAPPIEWGLVGAAASDAGRRAARVIEARGWAVNDVAFGPQSDHWPFHLAGLPTLMLFPGARLEGLTGQEARTLTDRWLRPHRPEDEWHPDFPLAGIGRYAELALEIVRALATEGNR